MSETPTPDAPPAPAQEPAAKDPAAKDPAKARFIAITLLRMSGALCVLLGVMITERRIDSPWWLGVILTLVGFVDVFLMPKILARRWKTPG
ncbi:hypothetical protein ACFOON_09600 [Novosphingobium piscinae]|uniref:Uncharacterized protein n=1 Tax=Novosphingobium piscinae TaxID=1507448 RepID=A0A7X1G0M5_9SPHN|nr:hypothetical protein [Novosphingobium piscinae]MBC2670446.1 hypothetical protein [Novosphingobium piscinae]